MNKKSEGDKYIKLAISHVKAHKKKEDFEDDI